MDGGEHSIVHWTMQRMMHVPFAAMTQVLKANEQWAQGFDKPMKLGVKKKV